MARKIPKKILQNTSSKVKKKTVGYYLKLYYIACCVCILIGGLGSLIFPPQPPCANSKSCSTDLTEKIENGAVGVFQGHTVVPPTINVALDNHQSVLGDNVPSAEKHIYVDLSTQTLYAYEGDKQIFQTLVSTGRWNKTPVGNFHIWEKLRSTRMTGGEGADFYDLPNVPYVMYFYRDFGLHGAYWHDNFGYTMSHGCVNLRQIDAETLYNWADGPSADELGTAVSVCNQFIGPSTCVQENPVN